MLKVPGRGGGASGGHLPSESSSALGLSDIAGTAVELLLTVGAWWSHNDDFGATFLAGAAAFGVDLK